MPRGRRCCCCNDLFVFNNGPLTLYRVEGAGSAISVTGYDSNDFIGGFVPNNFVFAIDYYNKLIFFTKIFNATTTLIANCDFNFKNIAAVTTLPTVNTNAFGIGVTAFDYINKYLYYYTNNYSAGPNTTACALKRIKYDGTDASTICTDTEPGDKHYSDVRLWNGKIYLVRQRLFGTFITGTHNSFMIERMDDVTGANRITLMVRDDTPSVLTWTYANRGFDVSGVRNKLIWIEQSAFVLSSDGPNTLKIKTANLDGTGETTLASWATGTILLPYGNAFYVCASEKDDCFYFGTRILTGQNPRASDHQIFKGTFDGTFEKVFDGSRITNPFDSPLAWQNVTDFELGCGFETTGPTYKGPG